jgi:hypothetical protein
MYSKTILSVSRRLIYNSALPDVFLSGERQGSADSSVNPDYIQLDRKSNYTPCLRSKPSQKLVKDNHGFRICEQQYSY